MDKDLFGYARKKRRPRIEQLLSKKDRDSLPKRATRIKILSRIIPRNVSFMYSLELHYLLSEAHATFINGQFVSTLMLSQSFIEQWSHSFLISKGYAKEAKRGFREILRIMKKQNYLPLPVIRKLEELRKLRNPFTHLKPRDYDFLLPKVTFMKQLEPDKFLEKKAQDALALSIQIPLLLKLAS